MFHFIHQFSFYIHVIIGAVSLVVFWLPIVAKKGSAFHKKSGNWFVWGMYSVSISGLLMSILVLIDPVAVRLPSDTLSEEKLARLIALNREASIFLLMLSVLVFNNVKQSIWVLRAKNDREKLKSSSHLLMIAGLGILGVVVGALGISRSNLLFQIFAGICIINAVGMTHYIYKSTLQSREWIIAHLGNIFGAGIGAYTAFFAFGGRRFFSEILAGNLQIIPWVLPAIIGILATRIYTVKYRKQFRVA